MQPLSLGERTALAEKILATKQQVAESVTEEFLVRHPDWLARYGERGRTLGIKDAAYHQSALACAIETGSTGPFADYARWTVSMLGARKIAAHFVIENLEQIGQTLQGLLSAADNDVVSAYVRAARDACAGPAAAPLVDAEEDVRTGMVSLRNEYLQAAIKGDRRAAARIALDALDRVADVVDIYVDLFQATQYEVVRMWQENQITVAEEHMATAITQYVMAQIYSRFDARDRDRGRVVITGIEGELHQVGANMVADVFEARGWNVRFLGTNVPQEDALQAIEEHKADVVGISATMLLSIPQAVRLVEALRHRFQAECPRLLLGGRAFNSSPALVKELRAEGAATDLRSALALIQDLDGRRPSRPPITLDDRPTG